jgi:hypothetical protein
MRGCRLISMGKGRRPDGRSSWDFRHERASDQVTLPAPRSASLASAHNPARWLGRDPCPGRSVLCSSGKEA